MTPGRLRYLRIKMRDKLWLRFPKASAVDIGMAVNDLLDVMLYEPTVAVAMECTDPDCACWDCVLALAAEVAMADAQRRVALEAEDEFD
jgi:hypothetical protein